ncbi:MAG: nucleotide exchange factor GrpE [Anaerolineales bacterium]|nr:nucleotide exchange factor GrpE [Anaerolineales bacterium]
MSNSEQQAAAEELETPDTPTPVDAEQPAPEPAVETPDYAKKIRRLERDLEDEQLYTQELQDKIQRMAADFQNSRRRLDKQLAEEIDRASAHLIKRLLPVVDDFDLAFANVPDELDPSADSWVEGFRQIQKKLHGLLDEEGVVIIPLDGEFDPTLHEAIGSEPSDTVPSNYIIATLRAGYTHKGRVLRPALVRIAQ